MEGLLLPTIFLFLSFTRSQFLNQLPEVHDDELQGLIPIIEHCGEDYSYRQLMISGIIRDLSIKFYRKIHEELWIPVEIYGDVSDWNSTRRQSCVVLFLSDQQINNFSITINEYSWIPGNIYVIPIQDEEGKTFDEEIWSSSAAELWKKKYVHKLIVSTNNRNLYFDPFEPSPPSPNRESLDFGIGNSFGTFKDLRESWDRLRRRESFEGYAANVALFPYITAEKDDLGRWSGLDAKILEVMSERMNITPHVYDPPEQFGWLWDGKFFGTLGRLIYHDSDLALNAFFVKDYETEDLEFTTNLNADKICVIVPKRPRVPEYLLILRIFSLQSWALIFIGNGLIALTYTGMTSVDPGPRIGKRWQKSRCKSSPFSWDSRNLTKTQRFLGTWIFLCFYPAKSKAEIHGERLQVAFGLMLSIVIGGCFTSQLASSLSRPAFLENIDTLAELDDSGIEILTSFPNLLHDVFADDESSTLRNLQAKLKLKNASVIENQILHKRNAGYLDRLHSFILAKNHNKEVHVVSECPQQYHLAYPITKGSPFLPRLNAIIQRLQGAGFYHKWFEDMKEPSKNDESQNPVIIRLPHLYIPFFILFMGLVMGGGIFCYELNPFSTNFSIKTESETKDTMEK